LDEPFSALDPQLRSHMRRELDELQRRLQVPMLLITHDPEDAEVFGEQVLHLREGVIESAATAHEALALIDCKFWHFPRCFVDESRRFDVRNIESHYNNVMPHGSICQTDDGANFC